MSRVSLACFHFILIFTLTDVTSCSVRSLLPPLSITRRCFLCFALMRTQSQPHMCFEFLSICLAFACIGALTMIAAFESSGCGTYLKEHHSNRSLTITLIVTHLTRTFIRNIRASCSATIRIPTGQPYRRSVYCTAFLFYVWWMRVFGWSEPSFIVFASHFRHIFCDQFTSKSSSYPPKRLTKLFSKKSHSTNHSNMALISKLVSGWQWLVCNIVCGSYCLR